MSTWLLNGCALPFFLVAVIAPAFVHRHPTYTGGPCIEQPAIPYPWFDCNAFMLVKPWRETQLTQHIEIVWHDAQHDRSNEGANE